MLGELKKAGISSVHAERLGKYRLWDFVRANHRVARPHVHNKALGGRMINDWMGMEISCKLPRIIQEL